MRKTLTFVALVLTAGSLVACKPFWEKDPPPAATAETTDPAVTTVQADPMKPGESAATEPTAVAGTDKPATEAKTGAGPEPASK